MCIRDSIWSVFITALLYFSAIFYDPTQMTFSIGGFNMQQIIKDVYKRQIW